MLLDFHFCFSKTRYSVYKWNFINFIILSLPFHEIYQNHSHHSSDSSLLLRSSILIGLFKLQFLSPPSLANSKIKAATISLLQFLSLSGSNCVIAGNVYAHFLALSFFLPQSFSFLCFAFFTRVQSRELSWVLWNESWVFAICQKAVKGLVTVLDLESLASCYSAHLAD